MAERKRSLYQCFSARVLFKRIYCAAGHRLSEVCLDGTINIERLVRGKPLVLPICQGCQDYHEMGPPIPKEERGWIKLLSK